MPEDHEVETWVVGPEYEGAHFDRLRMALKTLGYRTVDNSWGVGGSQELRTWDITGPGGSLRVEAETYMGLSVSGSAP
jgi:hypothetical protein